ncbi:MAG TPA: amidase, partial [Casimicrobiaceae bacterium]|nr:amidase [Casimicrobiaceae bacterium]
MSTEHPLPASIDEAARLLRDGSSSVESLTHAYLRRIEASQPAINAFITVTAERALETARRLDQELRNGRDRGPLHGIPVTYKDNIDTAGIPTTAGSALFRNRIPARDAAIVRRLDAAGMVMLGKSNMSEFASGSSGVNIFYGNVHNPWDLARAPGGSSSGTAAAVAADMCLTGVGTDAGGSIRQPASRCGIFGLRPTFGRVSLAGVWPRTRTLGAGGPMTRCVKDAALMMNALAGYDAEYPASRDAPAEDFTAQLGRGVDGLRLAVVDGYTFSDIDPEIETVLRAAVDLLANLGAQVETVVVPELTGALEYSALFANVLLYEFNQILGEQYRAADKSLFGPAV